MMLHTQPTCCDYCKNPFLLPDLAQPSAHQSTHLVITTLARRSIGSFYHGRCKEKVQSQEQIFSPDRSLQKQPCAICFTSLLPKKTRRQEIIGHRHPVATHHLFHLDCLQNYLSKDDQKPHRCPLCRVLFRGYLLKRGNPRIILILSFYVIFFMMWTIFNIYFFSREFPKDPSLRPFLS